jgi:hypothetical protein
MKIKKEVHEIGNEGTEKRVLKVNKFLNEREEGEKGRFDSICKRKKV